MRTRRYIKIEGCLAHLVEEKVVKTIHAKDLKESMESSTMNSGILPFGTIHLTRSEKNTRIVVAREPTVHTIYFAGTDETRTILTPIHIFVIWIRKGVVYAAFDGFMTCMPDTGSELVHRVPFPGRYRDGEICMDGIHLDQQKMNFPSWIDGVIEQILSVSLNQELIKLALAAMPTEFYEGNAKGLKRIVSFRHLREAMEKWESWTKSVLQKRPQDLLNDTRSLTWPEVLGAFDDFIKEQEVEE